ncbi:PTS system mannose/fructose/sorbose family transporter subunit IID [Lactovum miscens]|uniref:PTS system mannose-specific IID component n=1 Tax=Lactovum miscens TaxID=190387 RepID=A0A841C7G5_9LACT|nr:PTS system mannose/fructose/sorbose family transporter subunit IID [Lactovum miscens]MBB5888733.1 PTS system mannose-specific IID component [Lactovum miscens]
MENKKNKITLSKKDRINVVWRSMFLQGSWNYERMQNLGFLYAIIPALKKFYPAGSEGAKDALKRHMEFFNTHPYPAAPIIGVTLALEEEKANGADVDDAAINGVKVGMMGPLAGVGDPVFWFTIRPIFGAIAASLAAGGSIIGPIFFFLAWNIVRIAFLYYTQEFGYKQGTSITSDLGGGFLQQLTKGASILGMFILGVLIQRWVNISFTGPNAMLPKQPIADGGFVGEWITKSGDIVTRGAQLTAGSVKSAPTYQWLDQAGQAIGKGTTGTNGFAHYVTIDQLQGKIDGTTLHSILAQQSGGLGLSAFKQQSLSDVFTSLTPGFVALILTFIVIWILRKWKNRNAPLVIIIALFVFGILLHVAGLA